MWLGLRRVMASHEDKVELRRGGRTKGKFDLHELLGLGKLL